MDLPEKDLYSLSSNLDSASLIFCKFMSLFYTTIMSMKRCGQFWELDTFLPDRTQRCSRSVNFNSIYKIYSGVSQFFHLAEGYDLCHLMIRLLVSKFVQVARSTPTRFTLYFTFMQIDNVKCFN